MDAVAFYLPDVRGSWVVSEHPVQRGYWAVYNRKTKKFKRMGKMDLRGTRNGKTPYLKAKAEASRRNRALQSKEQV